MKKIAVILSVLISSGSFAREVAPGVELVFESTTVTGENVASGEYVSGKYVEEESGYFLFQNLLTVQTTSYSGSVRQNISMSSRHYFSIANPTQSKQQYTIRSWLCTNTNKCSDHQMIYYLNPGKSFQSQATTYLTANFLLPGKYILTAGSAVSGGENNQITDSKFIDIH